MDFLFVGPMLNLKIVIRLGKMLMLGKVGGGIQVLSVLSISCKLKINSNVKLLILKSFLSARFSKQINPISEE